MDGFKELLSENRQQIADDFMLELENKLKDYAMELRIKDIVELKNIKTDDHAKPYIGLENIGSWNSRFIPTESVSEGINNEYSKDDILFGKLRPYLAKAYIAPNSGVCSTEFFVLHTKKGYYNKYLLYRLLTPVFIGYISSKVAGVKMPRTTWADFSSISFDIPSLSIQQRIVSYLDNKTAKIDRDVSLLQKKRDAYTRLKSSIINRAITRGLNPNVKLKDSGVECIGMIPENWEVCRVKDCFKIISGNGFSIEFQGQESGDLPFCKASDLRGDYIKLTSAANYVNYDVADSQSYNIIPKFSILFPKIGESLKKNHRKINMLACCVDNNCAALVKRNNYSINILYAYYVTKCIDMTLLDNGGPVPSVNISKLMKLSIATPPISEQQTIANYLDTHCSRIDHAISIVDKQIDAYTRLKKSLINEVVTGKRKV